MSISLSSYDQLFSSSASESFSSIKQIPRKLPAVTRSCHKRTLVLDLDETLVHSTSDPIENPDNVVNVNNGGQNKTLFVKYRPGLFEFLNWASQKFELVVFTAATKDYAEQVINKFDAQRRILKYRFYREDCTEVAGHFVKDLGKLGRDLRKVVILDNSVTAFLYQLDNGIPISGWVEDQSDRELEKVCLILEKLTEFEDVRPVLNSFFQLPKRIQEFRGGLMKNDCF